MELLPLLRRGWRRRWVLVGAVVASVAAFVALGGSRSSGATSAIAWTQVTLDTPRSQLVTAAPAGADTLPWRAALLVHRMTTDASTRELANRLGVSQNELAVVDPSLVAPAVQTSMAVASARAAFLTLTPYALDVFLTDPTVPVISIEAGALQPAGAERLATAAVAVLKSQASPGGRFSSPIPTDADPRRQTLQPFAVDQVAPVAVRVFRAPTLSLKPIAGALFVFLLWCLIGSRLVPRLARRRRPRGRTLPA